MSGVNQKAEHHFQQLQAQLEKAKEKIRKRQESDISQWEKMVGPVPEFKGVITRF